MLCQFAFWKLCWCADDPLAGIHHADYGCVIATALHGMLPCPPTFIFDSGPRNQNTCAVLLAGKASWWRWCVSTSDHACLLQSLPEHIHVQCAEKPKSKSLSKR